MTTTNVGDVNARVRRSVALAAAGTFVGLIAFILETHTNANQNFLFYSITLFLVGLYTSSARELGKAIRMRGTVSGGGFGYRLPMAPAYVLLHYSIAVFAAVFSVRLSDSDGLGGLVLVALLVSLLSGLGGLIGGLLFGMVIYLELSSRGWNWLFSGLIALISGAVEAGLCYLTQMTLGALLIEFL